MKPTVWFLLVLLALRTVQGNHTCCQGSLISMYDNLQVPGTCPTPSETTADGQWHTIAESNCTANAPVCGRVVCVYALGVTRVLVLMQGCCVSTEAALEDLTATHPEFVCAAATDHRQLPASTTAAADENVSTPTPAPTPMTVGMGTRGRPSYMVVVLLIVLHSVVGWK